MAAPAAPRGIAQRLLWAVCTGFGFGYARIAPGTFGTLPGFLLVAAVFALPGWPLKVAFLVVCSILAIPIATWGERFFQSKDPHPVVIDEIVALPITAVFGPASLFYLGLAFVLNRAADILKPFPARQLQRLPEGVGIVVDDLFSGVYAGLALWICHHFFDADLRNMLPGWMLMPLM